MEGMGLKEKLQGGLDAIGNLKNKMKTKLTDDLNKDKSLNTQVKPPASITDVSGAADYAINKSGRAVKDYLNKGNS
jgi:hypothetical protein